MPSGAIQHATPRRLPHADRLRALHGFRLCGRQAVRAAAVATARARRQSPDAVAVAARGTKSDGGDAATDHACGRSGRRCDARLDHHGPLRRNLRPRRQAARLGSLPLALRPGARLIPTGPRRPPGTPPDAPPTGSEEYAPRALTPEDYVRLSGPFLEGQGFFERETARRTEQFGHIAHAFSTYEGKLKSPDAKPFVRGINSIQLVNDGKRWWVVTVFWEAETERTPLPEKYLKSVP
jgi:hypothetical protein